MQTVAEDTERTLRRRQARTGTSCSNRLSTRRIKVNPANPTDESNLVVTRDSKDTMAIPLIRSLATMDGPPNEVYEGAVRLYVDSEGGILQLVHFVSRLRELTQVRVLRLVGNHQVMEISLALREPMTLKETLGKIRGVDQVIAPQNPVSAPVSGDRTLGVRLTE